MIEDDLEDAELVQRSFRTVSEEMFEVYHVHRFRDAIQAIKQNQFHVVLLNLGLPDSAGLNGVERLMSETPQVPVIVLTGLDDETEAMKGIELGAQEFLRKEEISSSQLIRTIRHAIKRMQYLGRLVGEKSDAMRLKRLEDLGEIVRQTAKDIGSSVQSLGETALTENQLSIVDKIKKASAESLNAVARFVPNPIEFIEKKPDSPGKS